MGYTRFKIGDMDAAKVAKVAKIGHETVEPANVQTQESHSFASFATFAGVEAPYSEIPAKPLAAPSTPYDGPFGAALEALQTANPTDDAQRWAQAKVDARIFLDRWADSAEMLGWSDLDLFGLHPTHPLVRYDRMGLIWALRGNQVIGLEANWAQLSNSQRFYRGHWPAIIGSNRNG